MYLWFLKNDYESAPIKVQIKSQFKVLERNTANFSKHHSPSCYILAYNVSQYKHIMFIMHGMQGCLVSPENVESEFPFSLAKAFKYASVKSLGSLPRHTEALC